MKIKEEKKKRRKEEKKRNNERKKMKIQKRTTIEVKIQKGKERNCRKLDERENEAIRKEEERKKKERKKGLNFISMQDQQVI